MAESKFKIGDVVRLNSGGPLMTVSEVGTGHEGQYVSLKWFVQSGESFDALLGSQSIHQNMLTVVPTTERAVH